MSILVLNFTGAGKAHADRVSAHSFETKEQVEAFVKLCTKPRGWYWQVATIVQDGECLKTYLEALT